MSYRTGQQFRDWSVLLALASTLALLGCSTNRPSASKPRVNELNLVAMPVPVSAESRPNIDSINVRVYAVDSELPKAQPIRQGNLELLLYDGLVREGFVETNQLLRAWTFPPAELASRVFTSAVGTGYFFVLSWGKDHPQSNTLTVVARYRPLEGPPVYSSACFIELPPPAPVTPQPAPPAPGK